MSYRSISRSFVLLGIRFYQRAVSPALPSACRFEPTCSQFAYEAVDRFGIVRGCWLTVRRLLRCTPLQARGYDPVPELVSRETPRLVRLSSEEA